MANEHEIISIYIRVHPYQEAFFKRMYGTNIVGHRGNNADFLHGWFVHRLRKIRSYQYDCHICTEPQTSAIIFELSKQNLSKYGRFLKNGSRNALEKIIQRHIMNALAVHVRARVSKQRRYGEITDAIQHFCDTYGITEDDYAFESLQKAYMRMERVV